MPRGSGTPAPLFVAELRPPQSMPPAGFRAMMLIGAGLLAVLGGVFWIAGAWPVAGFFGLDLLLLYIAFKISFRRARARERVVLEHGRLTVQRFGPRGARETHELQPYWAQVVLEGEETARRLFLRSHGRRIEIGRFLAPGEKDTLGARLMRELESARGRGDVQASW